MLLGLAWGDGPSELSTIRVAAELSACCRLDCSLVEGSHFHSTCDCRDLWPLIFSFFFFVPGFLSILDFNVEAFLLPCRWGYC
jgi:hypothetical protein